MIESVNLLGKFDGVILFSDFDDTLCDTHLTDGLAGDTLPGISKKNMDAIAYFASEGGLFTIATGRSKWTLAPYENVIPFGAPAVLGNGSVIYDYLAGKEMMHAQLDSQCPTHMAEVASRYPHIGFEIQFPEVAHVFNPNEYSHRHIKRLALPVILGPLEEAPRPWTKLVLHGTHEVLVEGQTYILEQWGALYECIFSNSSLLEITPRGVTKGASVQKVAQQLGIAPEHVYCVGDNQNDLSMLAVSAIPFAPENCAAEVRASNPVMVRACLDDAVAHVLDEKYG